MQEQRVAHAAWRLCTLMSCSDAASIVLDVLRRSVRGVGCDCIALSGGIDTTTVALAARLEGLPLLGITAYYAGGLPRDLPYAIHAAGALGIPLRVVEIDESFIVARGRLILECTRRSDYIELRNDIVFLRVLEEAARQGCKCMFLGDGGDEIFAGYSFMLLLGEEELKRKILAMATQGRYPGLELAECIGVGVEAPLLSDELVEIVLRTPAECLRYGMEGKRLLRKILSSHGLGLIAERRKTPAEEGAGTDVLSKRWLEEAAGVKLAEYAHA